MENPSLRMKAPRGSCKGHENLGFWELGKTNHQAMEKAQKGNWGGRGGGITRRCGPLLVKDANCMKWGEKGQNLREGGMRRKGKRWVLMNTKDS